MKNFGNKTIYDVFDEFKKISEKSLLFEYKHNFDEPNIHRFYFLNVLMFKFSLHITIALEFLFLKDKIIFFRDKFLISTKRTFTGIKIENDLIYSLFINFAYRLLKMNYVIKL